MLLIVTNQFLRHSKIHLFSFRERQNLNSERLGDSYLQSTPFPIALFLIVSFNPYIVISQCFNTKGLRCFYPEVLGMSTSATSTTTRQNFSPSLKETLRR